ncbi:MAG: hypothetical protein HVN34_11970 [Methanobacteriaceae archaeon]|nr:hypothetical protein [Methanobacteriaceae archaeon]
MDCADSGELETPSSLPLDLPLSSPSPELPRPDRFYYLKLQWDSISAEPLIGGLLGQLSWRYPFMGVGAIMVVVFLLLLILMPNVKEEIGE